VRFVLGVLVLLVVGLVALRSVRSLLWDEGIVPRGFVLVPVSYLAVVWALPAAGAVATLLGMLSHRGLPPISRGGPLVDPHPTPCPHPVVFRVVSRGRNVEALRATVAAVRAQMAALPLFDWSVEVVTDVPVPLVDTPRLRRLVVPEDYRTPAGSLFKARALHYASAHSTLTPDTWIFHLDEESQLSPSLVVGIRDAIVEEEASGRHRIGQGVILYGRSLRRHPFLTLADSVRTGDDLGRFHLQARLGVTMFGLHGSFILVRASVEQQSDFDVGPEGSITEDAFWAVRQMALGNRCRWVDGYLLEQSTQSVADFVRQRRRWFSGLVRVVLYAETTLPVRLLLALFMAIWSLSWLGMSYTLANLFLGLRTLRCSPPPPTSPWSPRRRPTSSDWP
jgi:egghead protein (zeste-white 4 protein)